MSHLSSIPPHPSPDFRVGEAVFVHLDQQTARRCGWFARRLGHVTYVCADKVQVAFTNGEVYIGSPVFLRRLQRKDTP